MKITNKHNLVHSKICLTLLTLKVKINQTKLRVIEILQGIDKAQALKNIVKKLSKMLREIQVN